MTKEGIKAEVQDKNGHDLKASQIQDVKVDIKQNIKRKHHRGHGHEYDFEEHKLSLKEFQVGHPESNINVENPQESQGLSEAQAKLRLQQDGKNVLKPADQQPEIIKFLKQFTDLIIILLLIAGSLCYMVAGLQHDDPVSFQDDIILATVLIGLTLVLVIMTYATERQANSVIKKIMVLIPQDCRVIRGGVEQQIPAQNLVVGDVVRVQIGSRIPADCRAIFVQDLKVETSSLTGEQALIPVTVEKQGDLVNEARNILFMSTNCLQGSGLAVVVRCGDNTMIGSINKLASSTKSKKTLLQIELDKFVYFIFCYAFGMIAVFFTLGMAVPKDPNIKKRAITAIVDGFILVLVANIPEGLPITVSMILTISIQKLKQRNVLVKKLQIIETLGSASYIASDKTGTLTLNKMTVENVFVNDMIQNVTQMYPGARNSIILSRQELTLGSQKQSANLNSLAKVSMGLARLSQNNYSNKRKSSLYKPSMGIVGENSLKPNEDGSFHYSRQNQLMESNKYERSSMSTFDMNPLYEFGHYQWNDASPIVKLLTIAAVQNKAKFAQPAQGESQITLSISERKILGDATESALLRYCEQHFPVDVMRKSFAPKFEIPFSSVNKWALSVCQSPSNKEEDLIFMKGAPEWLIRKCTHYYLNNQAKPIDEAFEFKWKDAQLRFASLGERVLGFAYKLKPQAPTQWYEDALQEYQKPDGDHTHYDLFTSGFVFMGLISIVDPPRPSVPAAVEMCRKAGIKIAMVTGDNQVTAEAIAKKVGIITLQTRRELAQQINVREDQVQVNDERIGASVVTGDEIIMQLKTQEDWNKLIAKPEIVFARTTPQQKLQIVQNLQRLKHVVAVTGDGVNDSPALKQADIGVAMGNPDASDVARESADIILLDDQFGSIVNAIEEGRKVYDNLKKCIAYTITHLMPEVFPAFLNLAFGLPPGLVGITTLVIDLITEQGNGSALAYEQAEDSIMLRPPRNVQSERLVSWKLICYSYFLAGGCMLFVCTMSYLTVYWWYNVPFEAMYMTMNTGYFSGEAKQYPGFDWLTPKMQKQIQMESQSAYFLTIICSQCWHIFHCKTRLSSLYVHGVFNNTYVFGGVFFSLAIMFIVIYIPWLQMNIFYTGNPPGVCYLWNLVFLGFIHLFTEGYKYFGRNNQEEISFKYLVW